ncbi:glycosyltransferase family 9 protein [Tenacibaculum amylolyticum]|uniref:glycosyltransferase family 9 protein n=1 Tax=Tenacibaculum amylolyticum TaxID=104269 RepID=UPI0038931586
MKTATHIIVFRLSAMGDVAMTVPVIRALIEQHPDVKITFVSKPFLKPLFKNVRNVTFLSANVQKEHKGILGLFKLYKEIKRLQPTHFADLHNVLRSKIIRTFFKIGTSIPIAKIDKGRKEKKALTRTTQKVFKQLKTSHQRYADVFTSLGFPVDLNKRSSLVSHTLNSDNESLFGKKDRPWLGIAPFAAFASKTYPIDLMESVIKLLSLEDIQIFLFGGKADITTLKNIEQQYDNVTSVANTLGGLENELNLIANLDVMLSMDSGNAHFAAMQGTKTITLWGNTHPYAGFAPFNQPKEYCILPDLEKYPLLPCSIYGNKTISGYEDVMRSISPKQVVAKILLEIKKDYH